MNEPILVTTSEPVDPDDRPRFAIGHLSFTGTDITCLSEFYESIGFRSVMRRPDLAILELRGGTHCVIFDGPPGTASLDLMVDDLDDTHRLLESVGANPGPISQKSPHTVFTASDPEGNELVVYSSHAMGTV